MNLLAQLASLPQQAPRKERQKRRITKEGQERRAKVLQFLEGGKSYYTSQVAKAVGDTLTRTRSTLEVLEGEGILTSSQVINRGTKYTFWKLTEVISQ